jgi:hypothetical protein
VISVLIRKPLNTTQQKDTGRRKRQTAQYGDMALAVDARKENEDEPRAFRETV